MEKLTLSGSPHVRGKLSTRRIMIDVCIALTPACVMGIAWFGLRALAVLAVASFSAVAVEFAYQLGVNKLTVKQAVADFDFTSLVTGLLIGMNMAANIALYIPVIASVFAIAVVKMLFGGTGKNFFNPAAAGRVFVFLSFPAVYTAICEPIKSGTLTIVGEATPLTSFLKNGVAGDYSVWNMLIGNVPGVLGETCALALLLGGIYLVARGVIDWKYPLIFIATTGLLSCALYGTFEAFLPSVLGGGLILGAIFMATDYVTSPSTVLGNVIYFVCLGALTAILRQRNEAEVVSFVILLMNITVPLFDKYIVNKPFGKTGRVKKEA